MTTDQIKTDQATAPRCCQTCLYMATHEQCAGCLSEPGKPSPEVFPYTNYREGNWMKHMVRQQIEGKASIVVGWQGEADFRTNEAPADVAKRFRRIAEECGYCVGRLESWQGGHSLDIWTHEGAYRIIWDTTGATWSKVSIYELKPDDEGNLEYHADSWPPFDEDAFLAMRD
jgi:hypothetical protein